MTNCIYHWHWEVGKGELFLCNKPLPVSTSVNQRLLLYVGLNLRWCTLRSHDKIQRQFEKYKTETKFVNCWVFFWLFVFCCLFSCLNHPFCKSGLCGMSFGASHHVRHSLVLLVPHCSSHSHSDTTLKSHDTVSWPSASVTSETWGLMQ